MDTALSLAVGVAFPVLVAAAAASADVRQYLSAGDNASSHTWKGQHLTASRAVFVMPITPPLTSAPPTTSMPLATSAPLATSTLPATSSRPAKPGMPKHGKDSPDRDRRAFTPSGPRRPDGSG